MRTGFLRVSDSVVRVCQQWDYFTSILVSRGHYSLTSCKTLSKMLWSENIEQRGREREKVTHCWSDGGLGSICGEHHEQASISRVGTLLHTFGSVKFATYNGGQWKERIGLHSISEMPHTFTKVPQFAWSLVECSNICLYRSAAITEEQLTLPSHINGRPPVQPGDERAKPPAIKPW